MSLRLAFCALVLAASLPSARSQCLDWSPSFGWPGNGFQWETRNLVLHDDGNGPALYTVGGEFQNQAGASRGVLRWTGLGWSAPLGGTFAPSVDRLASVDLGAGPELVIATSYYPGTISQGAVNRVLRWDGAAWVAVGGDFNGEFKALTSYDSGTGPQLYVAGGFTSAGGTAVSRIARWDGVSWNDVGGGIASGEIVAFAVHDDGSGSALYAAGGFSSAGGVPAQSIARWNGTSWSSVGVGFGGSGVAVAALCSHAGSLYAGGTFSFAGGNPVSNVARWNGATWSGFAPLSASGFGPVVQAITAFDDGTGARIYIGGTFTNSGVVQLSRIARLNGTSWTALGTGISGVTGSAVQALQGWNDGTGPRLFAAGSFAVAGGKPSKNVAQWGIPCYAPVIAQQPVDHTAAFGTPVVFSILAHGTATVTYRWRKDGADLQDGGAVSGATTPTLGLDYWSFNDAGEYDCLVTNPFGISLSDAATLTVPAGGVTGTPVRVASIVTLPQPVPGSGEIYTGLMEHHQSVDSDVVFTARLNGTTQENGVESASLWRQGSAELLFRVGDGAPGSPAGVNLGGPTVGFAQPKAATGGRLAFLTGLSGPGVTSSSDTALVHRDAFGAELVAREGQTPIGQPPGSRLGHFGFDTWFVLGDSGACVFSDQLLQSNGAFLTSGLWYWERPTGVRALALTGMPAPGTGTNYALVGQYPDLTPSGDVAFTANLANGQGSGVFYGRPGAVQVRVKTGDPAPDEPNGTISPSGEVVTDSAGTLVFNGKLSTPGNPDRSVLYRLGTSGGTRIATQGDPAPGAGPTGTILSPSPLAITDAGSVFFVSGIQNNCPVPPCAGEGVYHWRPGELSPVLLRNAGPLPEVPRNWSQEEIVQVATNGLDQAVVQVRLHFGTSYQAVFGWSERNGLFPIAVPGTQLEVAKGDYRTVLDAYLMGEEGGRRSSSLSSQGRIALAIRFTDQSRGLYSGKFATFESLYFPAGEPFCAGDGTLATACPCANFGAVGHGCANSVNASGASLASAGVASVSDDSLTLLAAGAPATALSIFLQGDAAVRAGAPFGDGVRCAGGSLKRFASGNASRGIVSYPQPGDPSISERSALLGDPLGAGTTRYYQTYYRDPAASFCPPPAGNSWNVTNGLVVTWSP